MSQSSAVSNTSSSLYWRTRVPRRHAIHTDDTATSRTLLLNQCILHNLLIRPRCTYQCQTRVKKGAHVRNRRPVFVRFSAHEEHSPLLEPEVVRRKDTGKDLTAATMAQIIFEETKQGQALPVPALRSEEHGES